MRIFIRTIQSITIAVCVSLSTFLAPLSARVAEAAPPAALLPADMVSPAMDNSQCLTVDGANAATEPAVILAPCRGTPQQMWTHDSVSGKWTNGLNTSYCMAADKNSQGAWANNTRLRIALCTGPKALTFAPDANNAKVWRVVGTTLALDWNGLSVYNYHGGQAQQFSWLQPDLDIVNAQGCNITYPILVTETAKYARELACDHVAKVQPPYYNAKAVRDPSFFPGAVPVTATRISRIVQFPLLFKDNGYMRTSWRPQNWKTTGLYAPAGAIVTITVSGASASEMNVHAQLGVHTDFLVLSKEPIRYPNVTNRVKLAPGENLVRTPYGGIIELVSGTSITRTLAVTIAGAVAAPYFVLSSTTEAQWNAVRNSPTPWAVVENDKAVIYVDSKTIRTHTFDEIKSVAQWYRTLTINQEWLMGLDPADPLQIHRPPQGQQRFVDDIQISAGYGHSGYPIMANMWDLASRDVYRYAGGWGVLHELGHNNQMNPWAYVYGVESTVNLFSEHGFETMWGTSRLINEQLFSTTIREHLDNPAVTNKWDGVWTMLVFLEQIRLAFPHLNWNIWRQVYRTYRAMPDAEWNAINNDQKRYDKFMTVLCDVTNTNLSAHFTTWMVPISQSAKTYCAAKPAPQHDISRINNEKPLWYHPGTGSGVLREYWNRVSGASVMELTSNAAYPNSPSGYEVLTQSLSGRVNVADNFGERLRAYLVPPVTGIYRFWLSGDDSASFRISSDENPANVTVTLAITSATSDFDHLEIEQQRSAPIRLVAGRRYYVEVLHKEAGGRDHVSVGWTVPASGTLPAAARKVIDGRYLTPYFGDTKFEAKFDPRQPMNLRPGSDVVIAASVTNRNTAPIQNVQISVTLPSGFSLHPGSPGMWLYGVRFVRFRALTEAGGRGSWASMAELGVIDHTGAAIPRTGWSIKACSSFQSGEPCSNAIDGNSNTLWHTPWGGTPGYPHEMDINLGAPRRLTGFTYLPRQSGSNGRVGDYEFLVSEDGANWTKVASGNFADNSTLKTIRFAEPPPIRIYTTIPGPIAGFSTDMAALVLRSSTTATLGARAFGAGLTAFYDSINSRVYDSFAGNDGSRITATLSTSASALFVNESVTEGETQNFGAALFTLKDNAGGTAPGTIFATRWYTRAADGPRGAGVLPFWLDLINAAASGHNADLTVCYRDAELPSGVNESNLVLWQKTSTGWVSRGATSRNATTNCVTLNSVASFGAWAMCDPARGCSTAATTAVNEDLTRSVFVVTSTATPTLAPTVTPTATAAPVITPTVTLTATPTATPVVTLTASLTATATATSVVTPTASLTATATATPVVTLTASLTTTAAPAPTTTPSLTPTIPSTETPAPDATPTPTAK